MTYIISLYCIAYKHGEIVQVDDYCYDENYNKTNIKVDDARLSEYVKGYKVKTIHNHFLLLSNITMVVKMNDIRKIKLKQLRCM